MARIRTVKPELFLHEGLFDLERATGLPIIRCWIALFTQADREGRFEWRPRPLGKQCAPYDDFDFELVLNALSDKGFIVRYVVERREYAYIPTFLEHQCPNQREAASKLPAPTPEAIDIAKDTSRCEACTMRAYACTCKHMHARGEWNGTEWNGNGMEGVGADKPRKPQSLLPEDEPPLKEPDPEPEAPKSPPKIKAEEIPIPSALDTPEFRAVWVEWIADRRDRRLSLRGKFLRDKLADFVRYGPKACAAAMRETLRQGHQGCFPENFDHNGIKKGAKNGTENRTGPGQRFDPGAAGHHPAEPAGVGYSRSDTGGNGSAGGGRVVNGRWIPGA